MGLFNNFINKFTHKKENKIPLEVKLDIKTQKLKRDVEFILHNLPLSIIGGIEIIENVFEIESKSNQIFVYSTMNTIDIKRKIGKFIFDNKRWDKQEEITRKLFAEEKIDLDSFYETYDTKDYMKVYENVCLDVFAVYYGNESLTLDETAVAINSLYMKNLSDKTEDAESQEALDDLVDSLFDGDK